MQDDFNNLGVELVVLSTDTLYQHQSWKKTLDTLRYKNRDPKVIQFPLLDDNTKRVSYLYGMLHNAYSTSRMSGGFILLIQKTRSEPFSFIPAKWAGTFDEIKRTVIALQTSDKEHVLTPANWKPVTMFSCLSG